jgi:hypothetical protein
LVVLVAVGRVKGKASIGFECLSVWSLRTVLFDRRRNEEREKRGKRRRRMDR